MLSAVAAVSLALVVTAAPVDTPAADAANADDFEPSRIIDDALFYDGSAMTAAQIQSFLDGKIGTCQSNDCINILRADVSSRPVRISETTGNKVCDAFQGGTGLRISEIIYRAQVACGISAKVILATLQKEQGLITSKNPSQWNLDKAMGHACPDTAPCDPQYNGIGVQIIAGTTQLKTYKAARFARQPGTHTIQYNPKSSCGSMRITIQNYATAALYNYTPYLPNAAALTNLYGVGDSCSSYGNRNFWRDYTDWFGSTVVSTGTFRDVSTNHEFYEDIEWLADRGISNGWDAGSNQREFRPTLPVARDAMAAFLYRFAGAPFRDVPKDHPFYDEIAWLSGNRISTGWNVGEGLWEFRPEQAVTREAMATFLYRFAGSPEFTPPQESPFADIPTGHDFYREIAWLANSGISTGWDTGEQLEFRPRQVVTRQAMAAFLHRFDTVLSGD